MKLKTFTLFILLYLLSVANAFAAIDLVVSSVSWSPENPIVGDQIVFSAVITNQGTTAKTGSEIIGVAFLIGGNTVTWSDDYVGSLGAGESRIFTANGGINGSNFWTANTANSFTVTAWVDDQNRLGNQETIKNNNTKTANFTVSATPPAQATDVTIQALGGKTNLYSNGSNFAALIVKSTTAELGSVGSYEWQLKKTDGAAWARYAGKNYNNNNIRPTAAGTYRCKIKFADNATEYFSNEIVITADAVPSANYLTGNLTTNLPIIAVYTGSKQFPSPQGGCPQISGSGYADKTKLDVDVKILWNEQGGTNSLADMANNASVYYDRKAVMNYRGSTSRSMIKRSYAFSTGKKDLKSNGSVEKGKVDLFGLPEEKDWILYSAYNDKSMMRNKLSFDLYRQFGHYASATKYVELFVNDVYQGVYVLLEKYEENDNRINIITEEKLTTAGKTSIQPDEIGYIIKFDKTDGSAATWVRTPSLLGGMSNCGNVAGCGMASDAQGWELVYPEVSSDSDPRKNYIRSWLAQFEIALKNASSPQDWDALFETYIDVPSFVDFMIIDELARNTDGYRASMWFVKDAGGKLKCTPIWDFEMGFGNDDKYPAKQGVRECPSTTNQKPYATDIWQYNTNECEPFYPLPFWYAKLMENQCFKDIFRTRWEELRQTALAQANITSELETNSSLLNTSGALTREQSRWSWTDRNACPCEDSYAYCPWMITRWEANYQGVGNPAGKTTAWNDEYNLLKAWIAARLTWLDSQIETPSFGAVLTEQQQKDCAKISEKIISENKPAQTETGINITAENNHLYISASENIQRVRIYDTKGFLIYSKKNVNAENLQLPFAGIEQVLIVSVQTDTQSVVKKVLIRD